MKPLRILTIGVAALFGAALLVPAAQPASAGGWALTVLDPVPEHLEPGTSYTIGYWVLQHGTHPYEGELGRTGLRLVGKDGQELIFDAVELPEPAHYAVALAVPEAGEWAVYAMQGWFDEHEVGTLTVPGGLAVLPPDKSLVGSHDHGADDGHDSPWGAIHPNDMPGTAGAHDHAGQHGKADQQGKAGAAVANGDPADVATAAARQPDSGSSASVAALTAFGVVVVLLGVGLGVPRLRRRLPG